MAWSVIIVLGGGFALADATKVQAESFELFVQRDYQLTLNYCARKNLIVIF